MLAQHPITGKPIRVMKVSGQIWRDSKTVVYLSENADSTIPWNRWETIACGRQAIKTLTDKGIDIHVPIFLSEPGMSFSELRKYSEKSHLIVVTMDVIKEIGTEHFQKDPIKNILCLNEFGSLYPYIGKGWNGTIEDAVAILAMVLHYSFIAGISVSSIVDRQDRLKEMNIQLLSEEKRPASLWLIQQYYRPEKAKRAKEIRRCLEENVKCKYIDKIVLLNEADYSSDFPVGSEEKIQQIVIGKRLTYEMVIRTIFEDTIPKDVIVVFSNSDIFLEDSTRFLWSCNLDNKFLSLLRWDVPEAPNQESKLFGPRDDSQDTWILTSNSVKSRTWKWEDLQFPFGKNGCDNAVNVEMLRQKFLVVNPAYTIQTQHVHSSGFRTYNPQDIVDKPIFLHILPSGIHDMNPHENWPADKIFRKVNHRPFARRLQSVQDKEMKTFCSMIKRSEVFSYVPESDNTFTESQDVVLQLKDCFTNSSGLPYGFHDMYVGPSKRAKDLWSTTGIPGCQPVLDVPHACISVLTEKEQKSKESFCLQYLTKILQIRDLEGEFLCPKEDAFHEVLRLFRWQKREVPVLPQESNMGIYMKNALVWGCSDHELITAEDVDALRDAFLVPWHEQKPKSKKITILEDGQIIDMEWVAEFEEQQGDKYDVRVIWPGRTSLDRVASTLQDTEILIYANHDKIVPTWSWMWMLPEGAHVIELQNEMDPQGHSIHLAGACELDHWLVIMRKGLKDPMRKDSIKNTFKTLESLAQKKIADGKPVLWLPRSDIQGFFGHSGDSFREMAKLWGEKGYCEIKEHPVATLCWWGDVGGDGWLLYDRPNLDWLVTAPDVEQSWKHALFGNPTPPEGAAAWSFWPRRPRYVEQIVSKGLSARGYKERSQGVVFYGKIENKVQERRRTTADWSQVCDEYVMAQGVEKPYKYTQEEYLERLTDAKFGLCLAGFGRKCHREVECMAMGCVPVCEKEVDMDSYANPPKEGIHYLRVQTPEDVSKLLQTITEEKWTEMSEACRLWWKDNASCDGMFQLTSRLVGHKHNA